MTWFLCASETRRGRSRGGGVERRRRGRRRGGGVGRRRRGRRREVGAFKVGWSQLNETEEKKEL